MNGPVAPSLPDVPGRHVTDSELAALGSALRRLGLNERAVHACFRVACVAHAPLRAASRPARAVPSPAALVPWLFVAGRPVPRALAHKHLGPVLSQLLEAGFVCNDPGDATHVRSTVIIFPAGESLCVCDRRDALGGDVVAMPDDSAYHLRGCLPHRRVRRWLDVGTGCAILPLAARGLARTWRATDLHARSVSMATLGARLSGAMPCGIDVADLLQGADSDAWDLITFNAPIPEAAGAGPSDCPYRSDGGRPHLLSEFWAAAMQAIAPEGEVLLHSWLPDATWSHLDAPGQITVARYTPAETAIEFGVTRWQPAAAPGRRLVPVALSVNTPHVRRVDLAPT